LEKRAEQVLLGSEGSGGQGGEMAHDFELILGHSRGILRVSERYIK
jgi:hypothetical protein